MFRIQPSARLVAASLVATLAIAGCAGGEHGDVSGASALPVNQVPPVPGSQTPITAPVTTTASTISRSTPETLPAPEESVTAATVTGSGESPTTTAAPVGVDRATVDACALLSVAEVAEALGSDVGSSTPISGAGGNYRGCSWVSASDELVELTVAITNGLEAYNPDGWSRDWVPVGELGDESYLSHDFGFRIGFTRTDVSVMLNALGGVGDDASWTAVAKLVDARLQSTVALP